MPDTLNPGVHSKVKRWPEFPGVVLPVSVFWHEGRIYASGIPGLDVFAVDGLRDGC